MTRVLTNEFKRFRLEENHLILFNVHGGFMSAFSHNCVDNVISSRRW